MLLSKATTKLINSTCSCQKRLAHKLVEVELLVDVPNLGLRGARIPIAPGRARNVLIPSGKALLVIKGRAFSPLRDMKRKEESLYEKFGNTLTSNIRNTLNHNSKDSPSLSSSLPIDPLAPLILAEKTLLDSLSLLPILQFYRRPIIPAASTPSLLPGQKPSPSPSLASVVGTKNEIFGSVSEKELVAKLAEYGVLIEEGAGKLVSTKKGVEIDKGRIKNLGRYQYVIELKTIKESVEVEIEVLAEV